MKQILTVQKIKKCSECPHFNVNSYGGGCENRWFISFACKKRFNKKLIPDHETGQGRVKKEALSVYHTYPDWCPLDDYES